MAPSAGFTMFLLMSSMPWAAQAQTAGTWPVHSTERPAPRIVRPGPLAPAPPPSDAITLFDGVSLAAWRSAASAEAPARWRVADGYFEVTKGTGSSPPRARSATFNCTSNGRPRRRRREAARSGETAACFSWASTRYRFWIRTRIPPTPMASSRRIWAIPAVGQREPPTRRVADLRHRVPAAAL